MLRPLLSVWTSTPVSSSPSDGYRALPDPVIHRQLLRAAADGPIVVVDQLVAEAAHEWSSAGRSIEPRRPRSR